MYALTEDGLLAPHMIPLTQLVDKWRSEGQQVPYPDHKDGGVNAKALFLLESPGPKAVRTGYISRENPDPSAKNMTEALARARITRSESVLWNVVPYCLSTANQNKNASAAQIRAAVPYTMAFIERIVDLKAIVFCGKRAQSAGRYLTVDCAIFNTYHPGAQSFNHRALREHIHATFDQVKRHISD